MSTTNQHGENEENGMKWTDPLETDKKKRAEHDKSSLKLEQGAGRENNVSTSTTTIGGSKSPAEENSALLRLLSQPRQKSQMMQPTDSTGVLSKSGAKAGPLTDGGLNAAPAATVSGTPLQGILNQKPTKKPQKRNQTSQVTAPPKVKRGLPRNQDWEEDMRKILEDQKNALDQKKNGTLSADVPGQQQIGGVPNTLAPADNDRLRMLADAAARPAPPALALEQRPPAEGLTLGQNATTSEPRQRKPVVTKAALKEYPTIQKSAPLPMCPSTVPPSIQDDSTSAMASPSAAKPSEKQNTPAPVAHTPFSNFKLGSHLKKAANTQPGIPAKEVAKYLVDSANSTNTNDVLKALSPAKSSLSPKHLLMSQLKQFMGSSTTETEKKIGSNAESSLVHSKMSQQTQPNATDAVTKIESNHQQESEDTVKLPTEDQPNLRTSVSHTAQDKPTLISGTAARTAKIRAHEDTEKRQIQIEIGGVSKKQARKIARKVNKLIAKEKAKIAAQTHSNKKEKESKTPAEISSAVPKRNAEKEEGIRSNPGKAITTSESSTTTTGFLVVTPPMETAPAVSIGSESSTAPISPLEKLTALSNSPVNSSLSTLAHAMDSAEFPSLGSRKRELKNYRELHKEVKKPKTEASSERSTPNPAPSNETPVTTAALQNSSGPEPSDLYQFLGSNGEPLITDPTFQSRLVAFLASHAIAQKSPEVVGTPMMVNKVVMTKESVVEVQKGAQMVEASQTDVQKPPVLSKLTNETNRVPMPDVSVVETVQEVPVQDSQEDPKTKMVMLRKEKMKALWESRQESLLLGVLVVEKLAALAYQDKKTLESLSNDIFEALVKHRCV